MKAHSLVATVVTALSLISGITSHETTQSNATIVQLGGACASPDVMCAEGLYCESQTSQCLHDAAADDKKAAQLRLIKRQSSNTLITGAATGRGPVRRLPIQFLQQSRPDIFNMFIFALYSMQRVSESNSLSYYQISGIHGRPFIPWQEPSSPSQDTSTGYCTHDSALFATWHRPYLALIEQRLVAHAITEANRFTAGATRDRWLSAARNVRLPYWDWSASDLRSSIPSIVRTATITITRASSTGAPAQITIPNPLYSYRFTNSNFRNQYFQNPFRSDVVTLRQPPSNRGSSNNAIADQQMRNSYSARRQNTYNLFSIPTFREFSNTAFSAGGQPNGWTSVESIHNDIHANIGGDGHMSSVDYSSFDPIFWLHHCNVDRIVAMYQAIHPGRNVSPQPASGTFARRVTSSNQQDTIDTPLNPFRKSNGNYFTSRDVSSAGSIWTLNYAYPEVPIEYQGRPASELASFTTGRVNALYGPSSGNNKVKRQLNENADNSTSTIATPSTAVGDKHREWIAHMVFAPSDIDGSAECLVFLGDVSSNPLDRKLSDNLVGAGASFVKARPTMATNKKISATVPLTVALKEAGVNTDDPVECVKYLKANLHWVMQKGTEKIPLENVPSLILGVSSAEVTNGGGDTLPVWGEFETFYEITQDKPAGLTLADRNIVASKDIKSVVAEVGKAVDDASKSVKDTVDKVTNALGGGDDKKDKKEDDDKNDGNGGNNSNEDGNNNSRGGNNQD